jgi:hypothetical protein
MTQSMIRSMILGVVAIAVAMPLHAQMMAADSSAPASEAENTIAEVQTDGGVIMISDGGAFETAVPGQRVSTKSRLMVSNESAATVVYDDGCKQKFEKPGIYDISEKCVLPAAPVAVASSGGVSKAWIIGGALLIGYGAYEIIDNNNDDNNSPISP